MEQGPESFEKKKIQIRHLLRELEMRIDSGFERKKNFFKFFSNHLDAEMSLETAEKSGIKRELCEEKFNDSKTDQLAEDDCEKSSSDKNQTDQNDEKNNFTSDQLPAVKRKRKTVPFEKIYLDNLPQSEAYERSYMHRDTIKSVLVARNTHFVVTASIDGHIKFWKKQTIGIEFVKHLRAHLGKIEDMSINNPLGTLLATVSDDKSLKIFDVVNFDMINVTKLEFKPSCVEWCYTTTSTSTIHDPFPVIALQAQPISH
ncbi:WD domain containing protein 5 [Sarcoptes scabiei]|uniref:WD domain containing protein 5 n=1 Tax=Sarcoptes scabiei TaxID=52283 RepID=A0A132ALA1_SARSC|nr:WD domain containing protein 5 [Sarcoptes scabiei]